VEGDFMDLDNKIRTFFDELIEESKNIKNKVFTNLRNVADNPAYIFDLLKSYLLNYTRSEPEIAYLEEKKRAIIKNLEEIKNFGYEPQE
jgi:cell shape-determining protein MreC